MRLWLSAVVTASSGAIISFSLGSDQAALIARIASAEPIENHETVRRRKVGSELHVSITVSPIRDESGRVMAGTASCATSASPSTPRRPCARATSACGWWSRTPASSRSDAMDAGFDAHMTKPVDPDRLSEMLDDLLSSKSSVK